MHNEHICAYCRREQQPDHLRVDRNVEEVEGDQQIPEEDCDEGNEDNGQCAQEGGYWSINPQGREVQNRRYSNCCMIEHSILAKSIQNIKSCIHL